MAQAIKYYLAVCYNEIKTDSEGSEETDPVINAIRELPANELRNLRCWIRKIVAYSENKNLFRALALNCQDFQNACNQYLRNYHETQVMDWDTMEQISMNLGRLFLNILNLFKCFLDHTRTTLTRRFRKKPRIVEKWVEDAGKCYGGSFAYRFMCEVRDYGQHVGVPPLNLELCSRGDACLIDTGDEISNFRVGLGTKPLLKDKKIFKKLASEIKSHGQVVDLIPILEEWFTQVSALFEARQEIEIRSARNAARKIVSLRNEISAPEPAAMCILKMPNNHGGGELSPTMEWFPEREAEAILKQL